MYENLLPGTIGILSAIVVTIVGLWLLKRKIERSDTLLIEVK